MFLFITCMVCACVCLYVFVCSALMCVTYLSLVRLVLQRSPVTRISSPLLPRSLPARLRCEPRPKPDHHTLTPLHHTAPSACPLPSPQSGQPHHTACYATPRPGHTLCPSSLSTCFTIPPWHTPTQTHCSSVRPGLAARQAASTDSSGPAVMPVCQRLPLVRCHWSG